MKKDQSVGLKVFWVDLQNQNLSKLNISCPKNIQSDKKICQEVIKLSHPQNYVWGKVWIYSRNLWELAFISPQNWNLIMREKWRANGTVRDMTFIC